MTYVNKLRVSDVSLKGCSVQRVCCGAALGKVYLDCRCDIGTQFAAQKTLEDGCDYLRDVLFEAEFLDVVQELIRNVGSEACLAFLDECRVLFDVGVQISEGRWI